MAEMGVIPYSFKGITEYPRSQPFDAFPGQTQGVYITLASSRHTDLEGNIHQTSDNFQFILDKMMRPPHNILYVVGESKLANPLVIRAVIAYTLS